jgi:hypothetical protein
VRILTIIAALAAAAILAAGCGASPGAHPSSGASAAATVTCSLTVCAHGSAGQACEVGGYPGVVVQSDATALACDPEDSPGAGPVTDPSGVTCASLDSLGYCPGDDPTPASVQLSINVVPGCSYGGGGYPGFESPAPPDAFAAAVCTNAELNGGTGVISADATAGAFDAYQVTVTNNNSFAVNVSHVTIGYYDAQDDEISSVNQELGIVQIAAGATVSQVYDYTDAPSGTVSVSATSYQP